MVSTRAMMLWSMAAVAGSVVWSLLMRHATMIVSPRLLPGARVRSRHQGGMGSSAVGRENVLHARGWIRCVHHRMLERHGFAQIPVRH
jgi:hypothetical protein